MDSDSDCVIMSNSEDEFTYDDNFDEDTYAHDEDMEIIEKADSDLINDVLDYQIISVEKIAEEMDNSISEVSLVINIPKTLTRILLNHFKWDKEKLMEKYYDGDQEKLFAEAHIVNPFEIKKSKQASSRRKQETNDCQVCYTTVKSSGMAGLQCGHLFCRDCWERYLKTKITSDGEVDSITCVAYKCGILVDDETVMSLLKSPADRARYQRFIMNSFVESNKLFRWCPSPGCTHIVKAVSSKPKLIKCECDHVFCFGCGESWHEPVNCAFLKKWIKKCNDDSETMNWLKVNTKNCTKCDAMIEKNGGCNHMTCRNQKCRYEFCWICLGDWKEHTGDAYRCSSFVSTELQESSRAALEKYLFYCNRYISHQQSLKLEGELYQMVEGKMHEIINEHNQSWVDVRYLKDAVDVLRASRQTLSYTYVFAYYVQKNNQVEIFEANQNDLHQAVENLSGYLEKDIVNEDFLEIKMKVSDICRYCEDRRKALLKHVDEGKEKNWWNFG